MRNLILFVLLSVFSFTHAQDSVINKLDANGKKHGKWVVKFHLKDKNIVRYIGNFDHGVPYGKFVHYYQNEKVKAIAHFSESGKIQRSVLYHKKTGNIMAQGKYLRTITTKGDTTYTKDSVWSFYDPNGAIISEETFVKGVKNGSSKVFYLNGKVASEHNYVNGKQDGSYKEYFENGNVKEEGVLKDRNFIGILTQYHPNGAMMSRGRYVAGVKHGFWVVYDYNGRVKNKYYYKHGKLLENEKEIQQFIEELKANKKK